LFFVVLRTSTEPPDALDCVFGLFGNLWRRRRRRRGASAWFHDVLTCGVKVLEY
jgi:hypothetical protein